MIEACCITKIETNYISVSLQNVILCKYNLTNMYGDMEMTESGSVNKCYYFLYY